MMRSFVLAMGLLALMPQMKAASYVHVIRESQAWAIGNDTVERAISFSSKPGLETQSLTYKPTGRDFTSYSRSVNDTAAEFSFKAGKEQFTGRSLELLGASSKDVTGGKMLQVQMATKDKSIAVSVFYAVYDSSPAIRKWITITNHRKTPLTLTNLSFESLAAAPGTPAELAISGGYGGSDRDLFYTGRVSDAGIFIRNSRTGEGLAILNEAAGYLKRTEIGEGWSERFQVMYDTDLFPFQQTLEPGATFESAKSSLVFFHDGHGLEDSHWTVPSYAAHHIMRRPDRGGSPWIYNTWEPFERTIDEQKLKELAVDAHQMGIDIFTIDDGWQSEYGSNDIDTARFPGGFQGIKTVLDKNNLKLGLWVPLAAVSTNAPDYKAHPEWVCRDQNGAPKFTGTASGQRAVMCLGSGYRDAALKRLNDLIERYHPAYIKVDLTTVFNAYGEQPGCNAKNHYHRNWAESLYDIYAGLEYVGRGLYQSHPEVLVDYTFELWGEKHLIDPALLESADLDWLSNVSDGSPEDGGPAHARRLLYERAFSIPSETMLIGNLQGAIQPVEDRFATIIGSAPLLLGDLRKLSDTDRAWYNSKAAEFKKLRRHADLLDSFFPLGNWRQPGAATWDGFARLSRDSDGLIALFKNQSGTNSVEIQLVAPPSARYDVQSMITGESKGQVTAEELGKGWKVDLPGGHSTEVLALHRVTEK